MRHRNADRLAAVFKDKHILDPFILPQCVKPLAPQIDQLLHMIVRKLRDGCRMTGRIKDHFAFSICRRRFKKIVGHIVGRGRVLAQRWKIVVVFIDVIMLRHLAGAGTERTPVLGHLRPCLPVRSNHDPILCKRMPSQFCHCRFLLFISCCYAPSFGVISTPPTGRIEST